MVGTCDVLGWGTRQYGSQKVLCGAPAECQPCTDPGGMSKGAHTGPILLDLEESHYKELAPKSSDREQDIL